MNTIKKEISIFNLMNKYTHWLISKFTLIAKKTRLTPKQLVKIIIKNGMTYQKK